MKATGATSGLFAVATFLVQVNWPMPGYDQSNSRLNPYEQTINRADVRHVTFYWKNFDGEEAPGTSAQRSSPVEVDGIVYVGSTTGTLWARNAYTGANLWTYTTGGPVVSTPAVSMLSTFML